MRCKFCFATFQDVKNSILPKGHLPNEDAVKVVQELANIGFEKITFAGGEPTLCPWLFELIQVAKESGMTTMLVTNGSKLSDEFLDRHAHHLDWIALSIDSLNPETNVATGRAICGIKPLKSKDYYEIITRIKKHGYGLKINTVVNKENVEESFIDLIQFAKPKRWKIFQVLPIKGQNDEKIDQLTITNEAFDTFLSKHKHFQDYTTVVPETNEQIKGSYAMIDPAGRFFDNSSGEHNYSDPILKVGATDAIKQVNFDIAKFKDRGGLYDWNGL
jgi:radical S-adenosyl methionine domain-containing protein 2